MCVASARRLSNPITFAAVTVSFQGWRGGVPGRPRHCPLRCEDLKATPISHCCSAAPGSAAVVHAHAPCFQHILELLWQRLEKPKEAGLALATSRQVAMRSVGSSVSPFP